MKKYYQRSVLLLILVSIVGCKTGKRESKIQDAGPEVKITLENVSDQDRNNPNFQYVIRDCGLATSVNGRLIDATTLSFRIKGAKPGSECDLFIINPEASAVELGFRTESNLIYQADNVKIGKNLAGGLIATAYLQKQYFFKGNERSSLKLAVAFETEISASKAIVGDLKCTPPIFFSSDSFIKQNDKAGDFFFNAILNTKTNSSHTCQSLDIFIDTKLKYRATFTEGTSKPFKLKQGEVISIVEIPASAKAIVENPGEVVVTTGDENKSCEDGKIFNVESRSCE